MIFRGCWALDEDEFARAVEVTNALLAEPRARSKASVQVFCPDGSEPAPGAVGLGVNLLANAYSDDGQPRGGLGQHCAARSHGDHQFLNERCSLRSNVFIHR
jgi:hypothetical protein